MATPAVLKAEGNPPANYVDYFKQHKVSAIVRLNEKLYKDEDFYREKIRVYPMELRDGSDPQDGTVVDFITLAENEIVERKGVVVVHCRAGLGRTGTLIASYLMHEYSMEPKAAIAWVRMCRPGSVIGHQQVYLEQLGSRIKNLMYGRCVHDMEKRLSVKLEYNKARPYRHAAREIKRKNPNIVSHLPTKCRP